MNNLLIFGNGSQAKFMAYHFRREGWNVVAFTVDESFISEAHIDGLPVLPFKGIEKQFDPADYQMFVAVGSTKMNQLRAERCREAEILGYTIISYVSKTAVIWDGLELKPNTKIGESTICQPFTKIGRNVSIGSGCIIGHHTVIADNCFIASGVIVGGNVLIGANSFLGTGSVVRNDLKIGERCIIGAGVTLLEHTEDQSVYMNTSARKMPVKSDKIAF